MRELAKTYDPKSFEDRLYQEWMEKGYFRAEVDPNKKPYTIVMPPPNITGQLHVGHAMDCTLQDSIIRFKRMQGYSALWLPGTDHASIATETKIVEMMKKDGVTKEDLGRDGFLERAWAWKRQYGGRISEQLKKMGSSCDWSRERFTMDEGCSDAVKEVFIRLYEKKLIYRGSRMVNWCPCCKTSISDAEVEYETKDGSFWHLLYEVKETGELLELATTRPETMLGDTAVAINPEDERYKHLHGCHAILPLLNKEIPIVCDEHANMEKGTGVVKITPAHDPNDFEVGKRHGLPVIRVLTEDGHMTGALDKQKADELRASGRASADEPEVLDCGKYAGMTSAAARKEIVKDLEACGRLLKIEPLTHEVGTCYRCGTVIEPMVSKQWFVKMEPLAKPAIAAVRNKETRFVPERFDKIYYNWMENIKDWCISRQLWWGHRIPAYYCADCGEMVVSKEAVTICPKCGGHMTQDEDTLDTWFSSALWPFSTLGWPDDTEDLRYFYPTNTLVTGYDIIFFWVARMIFSAVEQTGKAPFGTVFLHGLVRDAQGRKMSKSLGNGVDPLKVIDDYGADALRLVLIDGVSPGNDTRFSEDKIKAARNFANKLWNANRFILMNLSDEIKKPELPKTLAIEDKWVLSKYNRLVKEVTENFDKFELGIAVSKLKDFIWDIVCDWYIELCKKRLQAGGEVSLGAQRVLIYVMTNTLKLLHPIMPFITEEIWQSLPHEGESIMVSDWPQYDENLCFAEEEAAFEKIMAAIRGIRNARAGMNVAPSRKASLYIATDSQEIFTQCSPYFESLASASQVHIAKQFEVEKAAVVVTDAARIFIPMGDLIDFEKELARLNKEKESCRKDIDIIQKKLSNEQFVSKAPAQLVEKERAKLAAANERMKKILASIAEL